MKSLENFSGSRGVAKDPPKKLSLGRPHCSKNFPVELVQNVEYNFQMYLERITYL